MNLSLSLVNMSSLLSPGPTASVEFSIVVMGIVVAVASGAIMDACLNVMVSQGLPETQCHLSGHTGPCCPHSSPCPGCVPEQPSALRTASALTAGLLDLLIEGHRDNAYEWPDTWTPSQAMGS